MSQREQFEKWEYNESSPGKDDPWDIWQAAQAAAVPEVLRKDQCDSDWQKGYVEGWNSCVASMLPWPPRMKSSQCDDDDPQPQSGIPYKATMIFDNETRVVRGVIADPQPQEQKVEPPVDGQSKSSFTPFVGGTPAGCGSLEPVAYGDKQDFDMSCDHIDAWRYKTENYTEPLYSADTIAALTKERNAFQDQCIALKLKHHEQIAALQAELVKATEGSEP